MGATLSMDKRVQGETTNRNPPPGGTHAHRGRPVLTLVLVFVGLALLLDGVAGERGWLANRRAQQQYDSAVQALEEARHRNAELREQIRRLREDPATIEEYARRELGFIKPGEKVFIVRDVHK